MSKFIIYNQSQYFYHISEVVYNIFKKYLDIDSIKLINCTSDNIDFNDDINLYLTFIPFNKLNIDQTPKKYIVYNFEQFTTDKIWSNIYINFLKKALYVIDYSLININKLNKLGINTFFMPYFSSGIYVHPDLPNIKKDIDVLFIGNLNNKRKEWLKELTNDTDNNINLKIITNLFYDKSIEYFARSKVVINIHFYKEQSTLEVSRIIPALENNCIVLSEKSNDPYYNIIYDDIIKITDLVKLRDDIKYILNNYDNCLFNNKNKLKTINNNNTINITELIRFIKNILINQK
jgi:hypothetical protein